MSSQTSHSPEAVKAARAGVTALFFTNGALFANFVPRFPELKDAFELSASEYGLVLAAFPAGAIIGGPFAAWFVNRFNSARVASLGTVKLGVLLFIASIFIGLAEAGNPTTPLILLFVLVFAMGGATDAIVDVGQNTHGLRVQRFYGRSIINGFHASWSLGAMTGGLMGMLATALALPIEIHIGISGLIFAIVGMVSRRFTLPGQDRQVDEDAANTHRIHVRNWPVAAALGMLLVLAISGVLVEDMAASWSTLFMRDYLDVAAAWAPAAYVFMLAFHFVGRATGDRLVDRLGVKRTIQLGGLLVIAGMTAAVILKDPVVTVIAFALAGFGSATTVPLAMNAADDISGLKPGVGLTIISWLMRFAFLVMPPIMGQIVNATSLLAPVAILPFAGIFVIVSTVVLTEKSTNQS
ncbi:MAG: MFS transporter [Gleimia sp.]|jgi:fucose permease